MEVDGKGRQNNTSPHARIAKWGSSMLMACGDHIGDRPRSSVAARHNRARPSRIGSRAKWASPLGSPGHRELRDKPGALRYGEETSGQAACEREAAPP